MAAESLACKKERAFVILSVNSNTGIELEGNGLELDLAGRAHACCTLPKILDQRPDTAAVLGEKRAEIVLLGNCEIEARNDDIHNRIFAIATIDTEIDLDRLLTLGRMRINENRPELCTPLLPAQAGSVQDLQSALHIALYEGFGCRARPCLRAKSGKQQTGRNQRRSRNCPG